MNQKYRDLLSSFILPNGLELKNRFIMAPMTHYSSNPDGTVSEAEIEYYARRSKGVSMVITACTYVTPNGKGFPGQFAGDKDEMISSLRQLATAIKGQGAKAVLQIFHGGRLSPKEIVPNREIVSASNIPAIRGTSDEIIIPRPLTEEEIVDIINAFGETTRRAIEAGFDGVEIHGANGYLIQQFFSPHANQREDQYGGTLEKRMNFPLSIVEKVKSVVSKHAKSPFIIGYRFSPEEPETAGITMEDTLALVNILADKGLDYLHVSLTDFFSTPRRGVEDLSKTRIEYLLETINNRVPLIGVGSIYTADQALSAFRTGVPLIALGRGLIIDPDWVLKIEEGRENEIMTKLNADLQKQLDIPDPLWNMITAIPGWFPGVE